MKTSRTACLELGVWVRHTRNKYMVWPGRRSKLDISALMIDVKWIC
jgi:hypothetical protein